MTIQRIRERAEESLKRSRLADFPEQVRTARLDADVLIAHVLKKDRTWVLFHRADDVQADDEKAIFSCVEKRKTGLPVAYITGRKEFFGTDFLVTPDVLIPKPDTELLVEQTLSKLKSRGAAASICDMCAGSGCVGISVAKSAPAQTRSLTLVDVSEDALAVARKNATRIVGARGGISFVRSDLFSDVRGSFDIITANPPYVPRTVALKLLEDGRREPLLALDGDGEGTSSDDGLSVMRKLVPQARAHLRRGGVLLVETGEYNAQKTAELFEEAGFARVRIETDMNGMMRNVIGYA